MQWVLRVALFTGALSIAFGIPKARLQAQPISAEDAPAFASDTALARAIGAGDGFAARRLLALQFVFVDAEGKIHSRKDVLTELKGLAATTADGVRARSYGLLSVVSGRRRSARDTDVSFIDVWARQKGVWRALASQEAALAVPAALPAVAPAAEAQPYQCRNPCEAIPYRVRSPAEQEVVTAFQTITKAVFTHAAASWSMHVADEFVVFRSGQAPLAKIEQLAAIERDSNAPAEAGEVQNMRLAVYDDGALMLTTEAAPDGSRPFYRAARVWVRRGGQWLLALCMQTDVR